MWTKIKYWLSDDAVDGVIFWIKTKDKMCGRNWLGNLTAPLWENISCTCCAFYRGVPLGIIIGVITTCLMS